VTHRQGLTPEVVPSTFAENLPLSSFEDIHEYPVSTATQKAVEVYQRLVVCSLPSVIRIFFNLAKAEAPDDAPDLVIGGMYLLACSCNQTDN
jgi:septum formation protein